MTFELADFWLDPYVYKPFSSPTHIAGDEFINVLGKLWTKSQFEATTDISKAAEEW